MTQTESSRGSLPSADDVLLDVAGVTCGYGPAVVLQNLNLQVIAGEVVGICGPNGAGKTTLLRAIAGELRPSSGQILYAGLDQSKRASTAARWGVAHVLEGRQLFGKLTVTENLKLGAAAAGNAAWQQTRDEIVTAFPMIGPLLERKAGLLSGGQQQLVAICRGLMATPKVLLIDEMSLGLAPDAADRILASTIVFCRHHAGTIVLVDQNYRLAHAHADRCLLMSEGRLRPLSDAEVTSTSVLF